MQALASNPAGSCCAGGGAGLTVEGAYLGCMEHLLLGESLVDPLIVGLSDAYELLRLGPAPACPSSCWAV